MKAAWFSVLLAATCVAACTSAAPAPSCRNPTPAEQACNACSGSSCGEQVAALVAQCPAYVQCFQACDCSDAACIAACAPSISLNTGCMPASGALVLCEELNCPASACAPAVDTGGVNGAACGAAGTVCNGSCVDPMLDSNNCGGCGNVCSGSTLCHDGVCVCALGYDSLCDGECVDEANDPSNCGGCGLECQGAESCVGGMCACTGGAAMCGGTCADEQTDVANCGSCGHRCATAQAGGPITCESGACACPKDRSICGGVFCVDKETDPLNCGACGAVCPTATPECSRGTCIPTPVPNCAPGGPGLTDCGVGSESCCATLDVAGGAFFRTYDPAVPEAGVATGPDGGAVGEADPATVSTFSLDKYLVTVGRFRQFVNAWNAYTGYYPPAGSGVHTYLNGGRGLVALNNTPAGDAGLTDSGVADATVTDGSPADATAPGATFEPGWIATDDPRVAPTDKNLACDPHLATWTPAAGSNENLPITCVTWQESYAFCIWDGGFLPSEAEWEYAAAGGSQQLEYPWGSTPPGVTNQYAIYGGGAGQCYYPTGALAACGGLASIAPVGTATLGAGLWGQLDMAGELQQWTLDQYAPFVDPSTNGVYLGGGATRSLRGSNFGSAIVPNPRADAAPEHRLAWVGFRCARLP